MKNNKEDIIKDLLSNNHHVLKEILTRRKFTPEAADLIMKEMIDITIEEIQPMRNYSRERQSNIFEININTPSGIYKDKVDIFKNKTLFNALERSEILNRLEDSNSPPEIKRP
ncbi:TPA_asm: hypothetical protein G4G51_004699, partial [Salmonella enterica subsp. enterica serovar Dublin]|nr:hypothetical protein [Salmonella enterica subsp. enterica serovar Dublin]EKR1405030.1 hypothetical protein [Salmonella enterica subsp. enterica serovar Dublin]HAC6853966.1 hypothetical protein [Salmonella enterica subsp. enterica serovar Dublin]HAE4980031.1 hypothetical protein [Salmonella enterica subsp. enterica serovar Dublin]